MQFGRNPESRLRSFRVELAVVVVSVGVPLSVVAACSPTLAPVGSRLSARVGSPPSVPAYFPSSALAGFQPSAQACFPSWSLAGSRSSAPVCFRPLVRVGFRSWAQAGSQAGFPSLVQVGFGFPSLARACFPISSPAGFRSSEFCSQVGAPSLGPVGSRSWALVEFQVGFPSSAQACFRVEFPSSVPTCSRDARSGASHWACYCFSPARVRSPDEFRREVLARFSPQPRRFP